jgi:hypothetical protein
MGKRSHPETVRAAAPPHAALRRDKKINSE